MNWFDTVGITNFAKSALTSAQKTIDKALDIQEETAKSGKIAKKSAEAENFFEEYGLSEQQPISTFLPGATSKENPSSILKPQQNLASSNSPGFWTDTWGSFFELKNESTVKKDTAENNSKVSTFPDSEKSDNAVLSQPHRAGLFPDETLATSNVPRDIVIETSHSVVAPQHDVHAESANVSYVVKCQKHFPLKNEEEVCKKQSDKISEIIVTEQPSSDSVVSVQPNNETLVSVACSIIPEEPLDIDKSILDSASCDIEHIVKSEEATSEMISDNEFVNASNAQLVLIDDNKCLDESEFLNVHMPESPPETPKKIETEYDVIDSRTNDASNNTMEDSSESFSRSASVEVVAPGSDYTLYEISSSTINIPELPKSLSENIVNWEWGAVDNIKPDVCITDENMNSNLLHNNEINDDHTLQITSPDSSFHTISTSSFTDNNAWAQNPKSSHFTDESQNSSNEEQNSHHSDGSSNSSKDDDDTDTAEVKEYDAKSSSSNESHATSSSSFVKCSAEENDCNSQRGQSPVSTTASERSDATKHESEQNTSGDENETATSSDIEILSPPNGENGDRNTSPLKHIWLPRPLRFRRSESPTSDSSKDSLMPVVNELEEVTYEVEYDSPTMFQTKGERTECRKDFHEDCSFEVLLQKQEELQNILETREKKIVELSKENIELQENEQRLKTLIQKMRADQAKDSRDIAALTKEFTRRLAQVENQLRDVTQERDRLHIQLEDIKIELAKRISAADFEEVMKEKDIQIQELTEEGQKLSKKELQHTTIIKKLRAKEEEMDRTIKSQSEKLEENSKEVERLRKSIGAKEEQEKKHIDAIRQLTNSTKKLEKEVASLKSSLEDSTEKELSLKKSLDSTYKDLTELRKSYAVKEQELEDLKSGLETEAKENLRQMLDNANKETAREKESLLYQMQELRCTLSRAEEEANLREKMFKTDIANLQKRLQEAEERNQDLTKNMSSATRPLIRQIENLQSSFNAQAISWEKIEKNLIDRLSDAQNQLALMSEKERSAMEKYIEYQSKVTVLETQNSTLRQEKLQLATELDSSKSNMVMLEENQSRETYTINKLKEKYASEISKINQEKANLESTMTTCLEQLDAEKRKVAKLEEELKFKEARAMIMSNVSPCPSPTGSARSSVSSIHNWSQDECHDHGMSTPVNSYRMSVYESLRLGSGSSLLESLQSQLKQREGEILQLQCEIHKLEQVKESMTRELVLLSEQNEELEKKLSKLESVEKEFKELDQKYNTLLQMYGEKIEETEELQLDLADVKSMYKAQIEELLRNK